jgi:hypothetical protein
MNPNLLPRHDDDLEVNDRVDFVSRPQDFFSESCPESCIRKCTRFFVNHNKVMSIALYAPKLGASREICAYAFCCGSEIQEARFTLGLNETPADLIKRIVPEIVQEFVRMAMMESSDSAS